MTRQSRNLRRLVIALALLLLIDTVAWALACRRLEQGVGEAEAAARQNGWSLATAAPHWAGWPLAAALDLGPFSVAGNVPPGFEYRAAAARIELALFRPATLAIRLGGAQSVAAQGQSAIALATSSNVVEADLTGASPIRAVIAGLRAGAITLDRASLAFPPNTLIADLAGLGLPGVSTPIGAIRLRASIEPAPPYAATPRDGAVAWRQAGGHISLDEAALRWDTLNASGAGTISLDDQLQPHAEGTIRATGLPQLLDDLVRLGQLAPAQANAAKAVITLLAPGGGAVELPVSLDGGLVRLARFPLLRLQPLAWE